MFHSAGVSFSPQTHSRRNKLFPFMMRAWQILVIVSVAAIANGFTVDHNHLYDNVGELSTPPRGSFESTVLLRALSSERAPIPLARAMLLRHFDKNGFDRTLLPIFRGLRTREDLATMLLAFHHWRREMGKTIRDGLEGEKDDKIYTFQVQEELNLTVYHTHNHKTRGFNIDLLNEVCKEAGKKCTTVHDTFDKCHDVSIGENPDAAGVGLLARHFHGCPMAVSSGITQAVAFTDLWLDFRGPARFFVPVGNPDNFDPNDITGKRIGLVRGWDSNILFLKRNNIKGMQSYLPNKWFIIDVPSETSDRLKNEEIDAAFLLLWSEYGVDDDQAGVIGGTPAGLEPIGDVLYCLDGLGVGARKDSPIIEWFNAALSKLKKNGKFAELCRNAKLKYGAWGRTDCIF